MSVRDDDGFANMQDKVKDQRRGYGRDHLMPEVMTDCVAEVRHGYSWSQCGRKRGHGVHGDLCKQHAKKESEQPGWYQSNTSHPGAFAQGKLYRLRQRLRQEMDVRDNVIRYEKKLRDEIESMLTWEDR